MNIDDKNENNHYQINYNKLVTSPIGFQKSKGRFQESVDKKSVLEKYLRDDKNTIEKSVFVSKGECRGAMLRKESNYGELVVKGPGSWATASRKSYKCSWMTKQVEFMEFSLNRFMGFVQTGEKVIRQTITGESCMVADGYCRPKKDKRSVIVWRATKVDKNVYRNLGVYRILKTGNFDLN